MEAVLAESVHRQCGETVALDGISLSIETAGVRVPGLWPVPELYASLLVLVAFTVVTAVSLVW